jgi:hypothetical protein
MICTHPLLIQHLLVWFVGFNLLLVAIALAQLARLVRRRAPIATGTKPRLVHPLAKGSPLGWRAREDENRAKIAADAQGLYDKQEQEWKRVRSLRAPAPVNRHRIAEEMIYG